MTRSIGGALDYRALSELNKPKDVEGMREAARELARSGLTEHGIAAALKLNVQIVREMLGPPHGVQA